MAAAVTEIVTHSNPQVARPGQHGGPKRNLVAPGYRAPANFEPCNWYRALLLLLRTYN